MCRDPCESLRFITNPVLRLSITTPRLKEVKENNTDPGWREDDSCLTTSPVQAFNRSGFLSKVTEDGSLNNVADLMVGSCLISSVVFLVFYVLFVKHPL
ncbi:hypothetical protein L596_020253 [Steinernema carpocapsae]|uniref:Uncharacterized protein n=1 Tax=Steinernema carpocapsae TaxID=34508 RepID=A0A4U5MT34_STECR|nr:hypothetical protein L596_020253 [Steinernema carpocapsae]